MMLSIGTLMYMYSVAVITLKLGWEQILAMQSVDNSRSIGESMLLLSFMLGACTY